MSQDVLKLILRRYARRITVNGVTCLSSNGDPTLIAVFEAAGVEDGSPLEDEPAAEEPPLEAATLEAPEHAVLETPEGHVG